MEKKLQHAYNLRFNQNNGRHITAAQTLALIAPRYKSSFIALAIEAYTATHPNGIDMNELLEISKNSKRSYQPKSTIVDNLNTKAAREETQFSDQAINSAMDFYDIESRQIKVS